MKPSLGATWARAAKARIPAAFVALAGGMVCALAIALWTAPLPALCTDVPGLLGPPLAARPGDELCLTQPGALWLVPALVPYLIVVVRRSLAESGLGGQLGLAAFRALLIGALALTLSGVTWSTATRGITLVGVLDQSKSVAQDAEARTTAAVRTLLEHVDEAAGNVPTVDRPRLHTLVLYGRTATTLALRDRDPTDLAADLAAAKLRIDDLGSDHAGALALAEAALDPGTRGRIVLFTDGTGSSAEREALRVAASRLEARDLEIVTFRLPTAGSGHDLVASSVHLPTEVRVGQTFEAKLAFEADRPTRAKVEVFVGDEPNPPWPEGIVTLREGTTEITAPVRATHPGSLVVRAKVSPAPDPASPTPSSPAPSSPTPSPENDPRPENDEAAASVRVTPRPRVLLASGRDPSSALARALRADHLVVDELAPSALPATLEELLPYDLVVLSDVARPSVPLAKERLLERFVGEHGGGLLMIGGENAFGVGGWQSSELERVLPVRFQGERQREQPTLALVLVLDKSGSMSSDDKLELIKEAARATARTLQSSDEIAVIAFDSRPSVLVRLQPASNRLRITSDLRRLAAGGGTNALPALREAFVQLSGSRARVKHVILLSDGQSPDTGLSAVLSDLRDAGVTVSSVGVGQGSGKAFLRRVAQQGGGRYSFSEDGTDVPRIFSRETQEVTRNAIREHRFFARVEKPVQALRGLDFATAPAFLGLVPIEPKPTAETLLRATSGEALWVRGRYGLGRTGAFASDAKPRWASAFVTWPGFAKFWSQVARDTLRPSAVFVGGAEVTAISVPDEGRVRVSVDVDVDPSTGFRNDLVGEVEAIDPLAPIVEGSTLPPTHVALRLVAPGRYEASLPMPPTGHRLFHARLHTPDAPDRRVAEGRARLDLPYPSELSPRALRPDEALLRSLQSLAIATPEADEALRDAALRPSRFEAKRHAEPLFGTLALYLVLPIFLLDLAARRFRSRR